MRNGRDEQIPYGEPRWTSNTSLLPKQLAETSLSLRLSHLLTGAGQSSLTANPAARRLRSSWKNERSPSCLRLRSWFAMPRVLTLLLVTAALFALGLVKAQEATLDSLTARVDTKCVKCVAVVMYWKMWKPRARKFGVCSKAVKCVKRRVQRQFCRECPENEEVGRVMGGFTPGCMSLCLGGNIPLIAQVQPHDER